MDDVIKSIKSYLYDRVSSPFYGILIITFLIIHYDLVIYLLADINPDDKIRKINDCLNANRLIAVVVVSVSIVLVGPILSIATYWWWSFGGMINKRIKFQRDVRVPISFAESLELKTKLNNLDGSIKTVQDEARDKVMEVERERDAILSRLETANLTISELNKEISKFTKNGTVSGRPENNYDDILGNQELCLILHEMASENNSGNDSINRSYLVDRKLSRNKNEADVFLDRLSGLGYLVSVNQRDYRLTTRGKSYVQWSETEGRK